MSVSMSGSGTVGLEVGWGEGLPVGGICVSQGTFSSCFMFWCRIFVLFEPYVRFHIFSWVRVTEWPPIGK